ncbi:thioredoxin domain-containing protein [Candidatus Saccharibacteria bacterium]|nr:thioredoxin domain-containing protein [Candidatus Saccharibacteria bacterium]
MEPENTTNTSGKVIRIIAIILIIAAIFGVIIASFNQPSAPISEQIWDEAMTIGNKDAKNYFVTYTDIVCPYCVAFENTLIENEEEFEKYLEDNDVLFEVRLSDFLYRYGQFQTKHSKYSALAAYCARDEGKFWEYYRHAISTIWHEFFETYGKEALTILDQKGKSYWLDLAKDIKIDTDTFKSCYENETPLDEIDTIAKKTSEHVSGLPAFKFNKYSPPGFNMTWGWEEAKAFFDEGLKNR